MSRNKHDRKLLSILATVLILGSCLLPTRAQQPGSIPLTFEPNRGQAPPNARYLARTAQGQVLLEDNQMDFFLPSAQGIQSLAIAFANSQKAAFQAEDARDGVANYYFRGQTTSKIEHVPLFRRIRSGGLYPGIDLIFHGTGQRLEYDFQIAPQVSPQVIRLQVDPSFDLHLDNDGSLLIHSKAARMRLLAPHASQSSPLAAKSNPVPVAYRILGPHEFGFQVGPYDPSQELLIDPVVSYAGTIEAQSTSVSGVAVDVEGDLLITGSTFSSQYPVINGQPAKLPDYQQVYLTKLDPTGQTILYSTYLPTASFTLVNAIAVDGAGSAYIAGETSDPNFPATAYPFGPMGSLDDTGFITKFDATGSIVYSTLLAPDFVIPHGLAVDSSGNALITGAGSPSLPLVNPYQSAFANCQITCTPAFFAKLNAAGNAYLFSSLLGGGVLGQGIALDTAGNIYVAGSNNNVYQSSAIPLKGQLQSASGTLFLDKFSPDGQTLLFGTFLGDYEISDDFQNNLAGIAVGADGTVYLGASSTVETFPFSLDSSRFPVAAQHEPAMVAIALDPALTALKYARYLGDGSMSSMAVDNQGNFYAAGTTGVEPIQPLNAVVADVGVGGVFFQLDPSGNPVQTSALTGHAIYQDVTSLAVDTKGAVYLAGNMQPQYLPFNEGVCQQYDPIVVGSNAYGLLSNSQHRCTSPPGIFYAKVAPENMPQISLSTYLPYVSLQNVGSADLHISSITFSGGLAGGTCGSTVPAGTTCILALTDAKGNYALGSVTITSDAVPSVQTFSPYGDPKNIGSPAGFFLYADVSKLVFAPISQGTVTPPHPMTVSNPAPTPLTIQSVSAVSPLTETSNCPASLASAASCTVQVSFDSTGAGLGSSLNIAFAGNPPSQFGPITLNPISPTPLLLSTDAITFGTETQGNPSLDRNITLTNVSSSPIAAPQAAITGDSSFSVVANTCPATLAVQQSCVLQMAMSTAVLEGHQATLEFSGSSTASVPLNGTVAAPAGFTPSTYHLQFQPALVGATSTQDLTLTAVYASEISTITFSSTDYSETDTCKGVIAAGDTCVFHITFQPTVAGADNAQLTIQAGPTLAAFSVSLAGSGQFELNLTPSLLDFGVGNTSGNPSAPQQVTLANITSSAVPYTLALTGPFTINSQCANPLPAQTSCNVAVSYAPVSAQADSGTLTVQVTGQTLSSTTVLAGSATIAASVGNLPAGFSFGSEDVGITTQPQTFSLTSDGPGPLKIASITSPADFPQTNNCPPSLAVGASCTVSITFKPSSAVGESGSLTISDNAQNSPQSIYLTGTGTTPTFTLAVVTGSTANRTVSAGQPALYTLSVTASSGFSGAVSFTCAGAPLYAACTLAPASVALTPGATQTVSVTVTTQTTASASLRKNASARPALFFAGISLPALLLLFSSRLRRMHRLFQAALCVSALLFLSVASACGGGGTSTPPPVTYQTPAGTYNLTFTATSGSTSLPITLVLNVQ